MKKCFFIICAIVFTGNAFISFAQNSNAAAAVKPPAPGTDVEISYGTFVKAPAGEIILSEYDAEKDANVNMSYVFDANSTLSNASSVDKIPAGADIDIYYVVANGKKAAKNVVVEPPSGNNTKSN